MWGGWHHSVATGLWSNKLICCRTVSNDSYPGDFYNSLPCGHSLLWSVFLIELKVVWKREKLGENFYCKAVLDTCDGNVFRSKWANYMETCWSPWNSHFSLSSCLPLQAPQQHTDRVSGFLHFFGWLAGQGTKNPDLCVHCFSFFNSCRIMQIMRTPDSESVWHIKDFCMIESVVLWSKTLILLSSFTSVGNSDHFFSCLVHTL